MGNTFQVPILQLEGLKENAPARHKPKELLAGVMSLGAVLGTITQTVLAPNGSRLG